MRIRIYKNKKTGYTQYCADIYRMYNKKEEMASAIIGYKWWHVIKFLLTPNNYRRYPKTNIVTSLK